jgi:hypothetical protein
VEQIDWFQTKFSRFSSSVHRIRRQSGWGTSLANWKTAVKGREADTALDAKSAVEGSEAKQCFAETIQQRSTRRDG